MPIQPAGAVAGTVEAFPDYIAGIIDLDGTPLLDIKPYVPAFDQQDDARAGWNENTGKNVADCSADDQFN